MANIITKFNIENTDMLTSQKKISSNLEILILSLSDNPAMIWTYLNFPHNNE